MILLWISPFFNVIFITSHVINCDIWKFWLMYTSRQCKNVWILYQSNARYRKQWTFSFHKKMSCFVFRLQFKYSTNRRIVRSTTKEYPYKFKRSNYVVIKANPSDFRFTQMNSLICAWRKVKLPNVGCTQSNHKSCCGAASR